MSERILNALMHLCAIIANINGGEVSVRGRSLVSAFLKHHLSAEVTEEYLRLFDEYLKKYRRKDEAPLKDISAGNQYPIIHSLRTDLSVNERVMVFLRLIEFVNEDDIVNENEQLFLDHVALEFNINPQDAAHVKSLLLGQPETDIPSQFIVQVSGKENGQNDKLEGAWVEKNRPHDFENDHFIQMDNFSGDLFFLYLNHLSTLIFIYKGNRLLYLDGMEIHARRIHIFNHASQIRGPGISTIHFADIMGRFTVENHRNKITYQARELNFSHHPDPETGKFSFCEESGSLLGFIGCKESMISDIIHMLSGRIPVTQGNIDINGYDLNKSRHYLRGLIGYIPGEDILLNGLTVYDNLYTSARLSSAFLPAEETAHKVLSFLDDHGLTAKKDVVVSEKNEGLSTLERTILNIGMELIREPFILAINNPFKDLTSLEEANVIAYLKSKAMDGMLIILGIEPPSSETFKLFDKVVIVDKGGYPVFYGLPAQAVTYFKTHASKANAAQAECPSCGNLESNHIFHILTEPAGDLRPTLNPVRRTSPEEWYKKFRKEHDNDKSEKLQKQRILPSGIFKIPDIDRQIGIYLYRAFKTRLISRKNLVLNVAVFPLMVIFFSFLIRSSFINYNFSENANIPLYLFTSNVLLFGIGMYTGAREIAANIPGIHRDFFLTNGRFSYFNANLLILSLLSLYQTVVFILLSCYILEIRHQFLFYGILLFSMSVAGMLIGLNLTNVLPSRNKISYFIPFILFLQFMMSGYPVPFSNWNKDMTNHGYTPILAEFMPVRWGFEAMAVNQFIKNPYQEFFFDMDKEIAHADFTIQEVLPLLQDALVEILRGIDEQMEPFKTKQHLKLIQTEIEEIAERDTIIFPFEYAHALTVNDFNEEIAEETLGYLTYVSMTLFQRSEELKAQRKIIERKIKRESGEDTFYHLQENFMNKSLKSLLTGNENKDSTHVAGAHVFPSRNQVYLIISNNWGRSHYFAHKKKFNHTYVETFWFNIAILWVIISILYFLLITDTIPYLSREFNKHISGQKTL